MEKAMIFNGSLNLFSLQSIYNNMGKDSSNKIGGSR